MLLHLKEHFKMNTLKTITSHFKGLKNLIEHLKIIW